MWEVFSSAYVFLPGFHLAYVTITRIVGYGDFVTLETFGSISEAEVTSLTYLDMNEFLQYQTFQTRVLIVVFCIVECLAYRIKLYNLSEPNLSSVTIIAGCVHHKVYVPAVERVRIAYYQTRSSEYLKQTGAVIIRSRRKHVPDIHGQTNWCAATCVAAV